jgi:hydroxypyruvate reductase
MNLREVLAKALALRFYDLYAVSRYGIPQWGQPSFDLIAVGKAAAQMADAALGAYEGSVGEVLVVLSDGAQPPEKSGANIRVLRASHPLPDARSVAAGEVALALAANGKSKELHVSVSGGTSSLLAVPVGGVTLDALRDVSLALLRSGAGVRDINVVRRHLSRVHGGGLVRTAWPRPTVSTIVSDVIGGAPHDVGSGPGAPDPTTIDDARRVLERYAPAYRGLPLVETLKPTDREASACSCEIGMGPETLSEQMVGELERQGYAARLLPPSTADVAQVAAEYVAAARALKAKQAIVRTAEPSVHVAVEHAGAGGRCTHLAAIVARDLPPGVELLAAASDGVDGTSGTGGALVDARSFAECPEEVDAAIASFDTGALCLRRGAALPSRPTGINFADVHVLVRHA